MQNFIQSASKLLLEYKNLIKKHFPEESTSKLAAFGLNKKISGKDTDLYRLLVKIIQVEGAGGQELRSTVRYSGINRFLSHLKKFIVDFRIVNDKVVHPGQATSRAMIEVIQLLSLSVARLDASIATRIENALWLIAKLGDEKQKSQLFNALEEQIERQPNYFTPLLNKYSHFLNLDHAAEAEEIDEAEEEKIAC